MKKSPNSDKSSVLPFFIDCKYNFVPVWESFASAVCWLVAALGRLDKVWECPFAERDLNAS